MKVVTYKEKVVNDVTNRMFLFIENIKERFPKLKVNLNKEQIQIICNIFYDKLSKKNKIYSLSECMDLLFSNGLFTAVDKEIDFDFECLKINKLILQKYFYYVEIEKILKQIDEQIQVTEKKKIKKVIKVKF